MDKRTSRPYRLRSSKIQARYPLRSRSDSVCEKINQQINQLINERVDQPKKQRVSPRVGLRTSKLNEVKTQKSKPVTNSNPKSSKLNGVKKIPKLKPKSVVKSNLKLKPVASVKPKKKSAVRAKQLELSDLNDHCILEVLERLPLADLCNMAEVSVRMKNLSQFWFQVKHRHVNTESLTTSRKKIHLTQIRSLMYNFGPMITTLRVSRKHFDFDDTQYDSPGNGQLKLLKLIGKYSSPTVLTLSHFWFHTNTILELIPVFKTIPTLHYRRMSCYCPDQKEFRNFADVLTRMFNALGMSNKLPQLVQLL